MNARALLLCAAALAAPSVAAPAPHDVAARAVSKYMSLPVAGLRMLTLPDYGPTIALSAMFDAAGAFARPEWAAFASRVLDDYAGNSSSNAWAVLHSKSVPWGYSVGDDMGLFPIAYLSRALAAGTPYGRGDDWALAIAVAEQYVLGWPLRLADDVRTMSRNTTWTGEPTNNATLWSDDQFMGVALVARLARAPGVPPATARRYVDFAASQQVSFATYMQDASSGLYRHGYNYASGDLSCCNWGRANGWIMMAHAEVVEAVSAVAPSHPQLPALLSIWRRHAAGIAAVQVQGDGRFHQVLDVPTTYLETSVTAMTLYSLITGVLGGWLDSATFEPVIDGAWAGMAQAVAADGTVSGICTGTGIGTDVAFYEARPTDYTESAPGIGAVFRAAVSYASWLERA